MLVCACACVRVCMCACVCVHTTMCSTSQTSMLHFTYRYATQMHTPFKNVRFLAAYNAGIQVIIKYYL